MIYILLILLIALCIFYYILFKQNILSPTVIACGMFIFSTVFAVLNVNVWMFTISPITVVIILTSLMSFGSGELLVNLLFYKHKQQIPYKAPKEPIYIPSWIIFLLCGFLGILLIHFYHETVEMAKSTGYKENKEGVLMLWYARRAATDSTGEGFKRDRIGSQSAYISQALAYIFSFIFLYNAVFFRRKETKYLLPILMYIPFIVLSTGRTKFIYLIAVWLVIGSVFYMQKKGWRPRFMGKIIVIGILGILFFFFLFVLAGSFKSSTLVKTAWSTISFYTGLSIPSLDNFILRPRQVQAYFGEHTLFGIYGFLRKIGFDYPFFYAPYDMVSFNGTRGNVYTIIRRYLEDFGYFGLYFILFFLGFLYSLMFLMTNKSRGFHILFYASIFYPIVEISIEERFFMSIISTGTIFLQIYLLVFYFLFFNKKYLSETMNYYFRCSK